MWQSLHIFLNGALEQVNIRPRKSRKLNSAFQENKRWEAFDIIFSGSVRKFIDVNFDEQHWWVHPFACIDEGGIFLGNLLKFWRYCLARTCNKVVSSCFALCLFEAVLLKLHPSPRGRHFQRAPGLKPPPYQTYHTTTPKNRSQ